MAAFYKKDLNFVILVMVFMEKGPDEFELLFKKNINGSNPLF
jgi:hypothetical protein